MLNRPISRVVLIAGASLLAIAPFFWWGSPSGHDFEFHMYSWMEVLGQWKHGIIYPRWAALAHWGYGEARFLFYPPASWSLGATLGAILPWKMVPGAYCWIALTLAGAAMYHLAREWFSPADALFAAVFYALNPYHLSIIYWRSAYAELLSAALVPLLLLCVLRIRQPGIRPTLWLSLLLAAAWLTNEPAAVMIYYSAAGLAVFMASHETLTHSTPDKQSIADRLRNPRVWRPLVRTALAMLLGIGLASAYLLPAIYEQRWVNISEVLAPGVRPIDNFLFTNTADGDHNRFNFLISIIALTEVAALAAVVCASLWSKRDHVGTAAPGCPAAQPPLQSSVSQSDSDSIPRSPASPSQDRSPWLLFSLWGTLCAFLMLPVSNILWQHLPKFRFVQLPFRWLLCMNVALAMLVTLTTKRLTPRALLFITLITALLYAGYRIQPPWWDMADDIREMSDAVADGTGYEGTDEYVPAHADSYELNKALPRISNDDGVKLDSKTLEWSAMDRHFTVQSDQDEDVTLRLFDYPAWDVFVNGRPVEIHTTEVTDLIMIPIGKGPNDVRITFRRTKDRVIGNIVSLLSLLIFVLLWLKSRGVQKRTTSRASLTTPNPVGSGA